MMGWQEYELEAICIRITDGSHWSPVSVENGLPMASVKDMHEFGINLESCRKISEEDYEKLIKNDCIPKIDDVLIAKDGSYLKHVFAWKHNIKLALLSSIAILRPNKQIVDPYFLSKYLATPLVKAKMKNYVTGAALPRIILKDFRKFKISIPELKTQQKIASILSAYDDLIENNTRRIKILEEMAQIIYKEWFVNFRFPGHEKVKFVDSSLGKIPEGWEAVPIRDIVKRLKAGNVYTEKEVNIEGNVIVIDQSTDEYLGFHNNEPDHTASPKNPIIIFGDHTCKMQIMVEPFSVGPNVIPFTTNGKVTTQFLFYLVNELVETKEYKRHWNELVAKHVVLPLMNIQKEFSRIVTSKLELIDNLKIKNQNLRKTRDLLLPQLMSAEVEV